MNRSPALAPLAFAVLLGLPSASLAQGKVQISAPLQGATLDALEENHLVYAVDPGPRGDHVHVYVDDEEVGILRKLEGSYPLQGLATGTRNICIKVVNKAHVPVGIEDCVRVTLK